LSRPCKYRLDAQHAVVGSIKTAAADLLGWYPDILLTANVTTSAYLVIGNERDFCGDFNHALLRYLESDLAGHPQDSPLQIFAGRKLYALLDGDARMVCSLDGASVVEEVAHLLNEAVVALTTLHVKHGPLAVYCLYHGSEDDIIMERLLPPFQDLLHKPVRFAHPPVLTLSPEELLGELADHYLFAALHEILYTSLMVENQQRVTHLQGVVQHIDHESGRLARRCAILRQVEIIEEIEVILLGATNSAKPSARGDPPCFAGGRGLRHRCRCSRPSGVRGSGLPQGAVLPQRKMTGHRNTRPAA